MIAGHSTVGPFLSSEAELFLYRNKDTIWPKIPGPPDVLSDLAENNSEVKRMGGSEYWTRVGGVNNSSIILVVCKTIIAHTPIS